jgi:hypothetical protein
MEDAEYNNIRTPSGQMRPQALQELELLEHQDLHQDWNEFVASRNLNAALRVEEGGRSRLAAALREGQVTPQEIYRNLEQFYKEAGNDAALRSLRRYGKRLGIDQPSLPF